MPGQHHICLALRTVLVVFVEDAAGWSARERLEGRKPRCLARDPDIAGRIYCGTSNEGLWVSDDAGDSWRPARAPLPHNRVTAVAIGPGERAGGAGAPGVVYVGTEPSAIYRSEDGGDSWESLDGLGQLPSAPTWSFPPRPQTHHVRWIEADPHRPGRVFACIEAGALVWSDDRGRSWHDRVAGGPYDTHTLATHPVEAGRLYSAAGDGYFESDDAGASWRQIEEGLAHRYLFGVAVDPGDANLVVVSAAPHPFRAYDPSSAESAIYRKRGGGEWRELRAGLPERDGTTISVLAATAPGIFWAANNRGVFRSDNGGDGWQRLALPWADAYLRSNVLAFVVRAGG